MVAVDGTNYSHTASAASTAMTCNAATKPYFPVNGSSVRIMAYYPSTMQYATTVRTFTVAHDQSQTAAGTANYKASDLMVGLPKADFADASSVSLIDGSGFGRKVKPTSLSIPLEFEHKMVKIRLNTTNNGATVRKVEMTGIKRSIDFNPSDTTFQNLALATGDTDAAANSVIMYEDATGSTSNVVCTALIPKQDLTSGTPFITVTTASGTPLVYKLPENYYFAPGKQYRFNVNINDYEITATSDVTDWDDDTSFNMGDGLAVRKNIKMNPLWYVAEYNMTGATTMGTTINTGSYYSWNEAMVLFSETKSAEAYEDYRAGNIVITNSNDNKTYHMPIGAEWRSIIPTSELVQNNRETIINFSGLRTSSEITKFGFDERTKNTGIWDVSYWVKKSSAEIHAIRYIGTAFCSAWKYVISGSQQTIYATLIDQIAPEDAADFYDNKFNNVIFGDDETNLAVRRDFYNLGYKSGTVSSVAYTHYWSTSNSKFDDNYKLQVYIGSNNFICYGYGPISTTSFCVRLFRDN